MDNFVLIRFSWLLNIVQDDQCDIAKSCCIEVGKLVFVWNREQIRLCITLYLFYRVE